MGLSGVDVWSPCGLVVCQKSLLMKQLQQGDAAKCSGGIGKEAAAIKQTAAGVSQRGGAVSSEGATGVTGCC
jgi:hypothetical protein